MAPKMKCIFYHETWKIRTPAPAMEESLCSPCHVVKNFFTTLFVKCSSALNFVSRFFGTHSALRIIFNCKIFSTVDHEADLTININKLQEKSCLIKKYFEKRYKIKKRIINFIIITLTSHIFRCIAKKFL